jgi:hypothetical protein
MIIKGIPDWIVWVAGAGVAVYIGWNLLKGGAFAGGLIQEIADICPVCSGASGTQAQCDACVKANQNKLLKGNVFG